MQSLCRICRWIWQRARTAAEPVSSTRKDRRSSSAAGTCVRREAHRGRDWIAGTNELDGLRTTAGVLLEELDVALTLCRGKAASLEDARDDQRVHEAESRKPRREAARRCADPFFS